MTASISGLVLAGGAGRRTGSRDKGLLPYRDTTLVGAVCAVIEPQVDGLMISCNRNHADYAALGYPLLSDLRPDYAGPLAGIESAASVYPGHWLLVVPCDTPQLPGDLAERLLSAARQQAADACYAHDGARGQYLCALLSRGFLATLPAFLDSGGRAVRDWYAGGRVSAVDFSDCPDAFVNYNAGAAVAPST